MANIDNYAPGVKTAVHGRPEARFGLTASGDLSTGRSFGLVRETVLVVDSLSDDHVLMDL